MKKILLSVLFTLLVLALVGCNSVEAALPPVTETVTTTVTSVTTSYVPTTIVSTVTTTEVITTTETVIVIPTTEAPVTTAPVMPVIAYIKITDVLTFSDDADPNPEGVAVHFSFYDSVSEIITWEGFSYTTHVERWTDTTDRYIHPPAFSDETFSSAGLDNEARIRPVGLNYRSDAYKLTVTMSDGKVFYAEWFK